MLAGWTHRLGPNLTRRRSPRTSTPIGLVAPALVAQRSPVQLIAGRPPLGHKAIHVFLEAIIVVPLQQVNHFMDQDVFQAFPWLLREVCI